ncbi:MAG: hypothetical protein K0Q77_2953 [Anaerosporomusa subterranea]|jgi:hypothetical protein|nr:hypothetical protein [Anaerosporomusa subterranea]
MVTLVALIVGSLLGHLIPGELFQSAYKEQGLHAKICPADYLVEPRRRVNVNRATHVFIHVGRSIVGNDKKGPASTESATENFRILVRPELAMPIIINTVREGRCASKALTGISV